MVWREKPSPHSCGPSIDDLFTVGAKCARSLFWRKTSPSSRAHHCPEGLFSAFLVLALYSSNDGCQVWREKHLPLPGFQLSSFPKVFLFRPSQVWCLCIEGILTRTLFGALIRACCAFVFAEGVLVRTFERSKPFGVCFGTCCAFIRAEGFLVWTFERSKPLGVCLALIVPLFVPKVFLFEPL